MLLVFYSRQKNRQSTGHNRPPYPCCRLLPVWITNCFAADQTRPVSSVVVVVDIISTTTTRLTVLLLIKYLWDVKLDVLLWTALNLCIDLLHSPFNVDDWLLRYADKTIQCAFYAHTPYIWARKVKSSTPSQLPPISNCSGYIVHSQRTDQNFIASLMSANQAWN